MHGSSAKSWNESKNYVLVALTTILVFNYVDRVALGILLQNIKTDLALTDTELGFLSGLGFALFYSVMGIPIARWADRGNRVAIISITVIFWSIAVAACGLAGSFLQLLLIRICVAVGEAGCVPPSYSLIADYFDRAERPRANAIYGMGGAIATVIGFSVAGWLNQYYGWRTTFLVLGAPGVLLAAIAWSSLKEPRRLARSASNTHQNDLECGEDASSAGLAEVATVLWSNRTFRHLLLCFSVVLLFLYGVMQWQPTFFVRSYGLTTGKLGTWLALTWGIGSLAGSYVGGEFSSRYAANNERLQLKMMAGAVALSGIFSIFIYIVPDRNIAFALIFVSFVGLTTVNGPLIATIQTLVPRDMRAVSFALVFLVANLIGMGLGPLAVGMMSDTLRHWAGEESLRYALLALSPGYLWAAWHAWEASKSVSDDVALAADELEHIRHEYIQHG